MPRKKEGLSQAEVRVHLKGLKTSRGKIMYLEKVLERKKLISEPTRKAVDRLHQKLLSKDPLAMAKNYEKAGMKIKAGPMYEKAGALFQAGKMYEESHSPLEALRTYKKAIKIYGKNPKNEYKDTYLARLYAVNVAKKVGKIDEAIKIHEGNRDFQGAAQIAREADRPEEAIRLYKREDKESNKAVKNNFDIAIIAERIGRIDEAIEYYDRLGAGQNTRIDYVDHAVKLAKKAGKVDKAVEIYMNHKRFRAAANVAERAGKIDEAIKIYAAKAYTLEAAELSEKSGKIDEAIKYFSSMRGTEYQDHAIELAEKAGKAGKAIALYKERGDFYEKAGKLMKAQSMRAEVDRLTSKKGSSKNLEKKVEAIITIGCIGFSAFFLSPNITGNVISSATQTSSNWIGGVLLATGAIGILLYFRKNN